MSSDAYALVEEVRRIGAALSVTADGSLELRGTVSEELVECIRARKPEIVALIRRGVASRTVDPAAWEAMNSLGHRFGDSVPIGEPWGFGTLWGMTPRGPIIDVGNVLVTFDFAEVGSEER